MGADWTRHQVRDRAWRASELASSLLMLLHRCPSTKRELQQDQATGDFDGGSTGAGSRWYVQLFINELEVPMPECSEQHGACRLSHVMRNLSIPNTVPSFRTVCAAGSGTYQPWLGTTYRAFGRLFGTLTSVLHSFVVLVVTATALCVVLVVFRALRQPRRKRASE